MTLYNPAPYFAIITEDGIGRILMRGERMAYVHAVDYEQAGFHFGKYMDDHGIRCSTVNVCPLSILCSPEEISEEKFTDITDITRYSGDTLRRWWKRIAGESD
jgi:hypothetical protein